MHLLVIEDERALCETIVRSLRRLAYSVDYCYDGEKALALLGGSFFSPFPIFCPHHSAGELKSLLRTKT